MFNNLVRPSWSTLDIKSTGDYDSYWSRMARNLGLLILPVIQNCCGCIWFLSAFNQSMSWFIRRNRAAAHESRKSSCIRTSSYDGPVGLDDRRCQTLGNFSLIVSTTMLSNLTLHQMFRFSIKAKRVSWREVLSYSDASFQTSFTRWFTSYWLELNILLQLLFVLSQLCNCNYWLFLQSLCWKSL